MGFKRPFDDEMFHELPFKHSRQLGFSDKSTQFEEFIPRHHAVPQKPLATVNEGDLSNPQGSETFDEESNFVYNGFDVDGCFDRVMKDCEGFAHSPHSSKYCELGLVPPRPCSPVETLYSFLLDQPARKQVPIGPDHQALIPEWEGSLGNQEASDTSKLSGTCVIPMPANMDGIVGKGRELCVCQDRGSIRCVRQHVKEAREELVKVLGSEKFRELGFCEMGEEVAQRWSDEDAILFHEVVYSNPVTLGRNFWNHLEAAFFSRAKHEIVSFYFNVFVLRRRATQNRSLMLDVDSDDDEWHGGYGGSLGTHFVEEDDEEEEEDDSAIESPLHQGADNFNEKVHPLHQEDGEEGVSVSDDDDADTREGGAEHMASFNEKRLNVDDDVSYTTFELGQDALNSAWTNCTKKDEAGVGEHQKKSKECSDPKVSTNGKDLQPTRSIMEEIFGHGSWGSK
ncbi:ELM2 domain protein [Hirschfeldia incana]|nr:ELM2 domain protein [Hirschfeldia incana]KAJ0257794.1 ELM2 domain protein [Hirschfeldia incana]